MVWRALDDSEYGIIVRLLILTAQRRNEIAALRWSELDFGRGVISLPGERTKNGKPHDIPMSETVRSLLLARPKNGRDFVFGEGAGPFSGMSQRKAMLDAKISASNDGYDMAPWVHHDLRRSVATGMAEIGIAPHIIESILNHTSGHMVIGIERRAESFGILVDGVGEVLGLADVDHEPAPINLDRMLDAVATGIFRLDEKILVALDADRLLDFGSSRSIATQ